MADKNLAQFSLEDGSTVLVEVDEPDSLVERVGISGGQLVLRASRSFDQALEMLMPLANSIVRKLQKLETPAEEIEVKFGLKLSAEAGVILTSVGGGEANYEITLKFKPPELS